MLAIAAGSARAFKAVMDSYMRDVFRFAYSVVSDTALAEDITQEVFLRLHGVEDGEQISNVGHYVVRMARNLLIDHSRSASGKICSQTTATIEDAFDLAIDEPSPEDMLIMRNEISGIFAALGGMSELCSRIFWQSRAEGFLNHEIAQMQGVCISTVEKNISRAKKHCASHMRQLHS